jgi:lipopolysaccharide transport system ATP-binding protein
MAAISVEGISKAFTIARGREMHDTLRDAIAASLRRLGRRRVAGAERIFWALRDVSFAVNHGEAMAVIGSNGAGKSTLLKILSRITLPTSGRAVIRGRVGSLLEVGTGFHPELSGRENVYLSGAILGMKRHEITTRFDDIIAFAGVESFVDQPVKRYSSGMFVRLAFAVAAHLEPDILIVDEVLAVGDAAFQQRCLTKMHNATREGRTVLFVSHNLSAVQQLTRRAVLLTEGRVTAEGPTDDVVRAYLRTAVEGNGTLFDATTAPRRYPHLPRDVEFLSLELLNDGLTLLPADSALKLRARVRGNRSITDWRFSITILRADGNPVGSVFSDSLAIKGSEEALFDLAIRDHRLAPGRYRLTVATAKGTSPTAHTVFDALCDILPFEVMPPQHADGTRALWHPTWGPILFPEPTVCRLD